MPQCTRVFLKSGATSLITLELLYSVYLSTNNETISRDIFSSHNSATTFICFSLGKNKVNIETFEVQVVLVIILFFRDRSRFVAIKLKHCAINIGVIELICCSFGYGANSYGWKWNISDRHGLVIQGDNYGDRVPFQPHIVNRVDAQDNTKHDRNYPPNAEICPINLY